MRFFLSCMLLYKPFLDLPLGLAFDTLCSFNPLDALIIYDAVLRKCYLRVLYPVWYRLYALAFALHNWATKRKTIALNAAK